MEERAENEVKCRKAKFPERPTNISERCFQSVRICVSVLDRRTAKCGRGEGEREGEGEGGRKREMVGERVVQKKRGRNGGMVERGREKEGKKGREGANEKVREKERENMNYLFVRQIEQRKRKC